MVRIRTKRIITINVIMAIFVITLVILVLSGYLDAKNNSASHSEPGGKGCNKIGILLPDSADSGRWDSKDRPALIDGIKKYLPDAMVDYVNAEGNATRQEKQAKQAINQGDCILVVGPADSSLATSIVENARKYGVPVIAYDRLIQDKFINSYVSFDNFKVGELQGQYIAAHYREYLNGGNANIAMINGAQTDNNALEFRQGALNALQPLFDSGELKRVYDTFTPYWKNDIARTETDQALSNNHNDIQIVYAANDGVASGVIASLKAQKLNGKVLVTGQDATVVGIRNIIIGDQAMTVYKNIAIEADATAHIVDLIVKGLPVTSLTGDITTRTSDGGNIPSILETPVSVDKTNISKTVLADGYVTKSNICDNLPANIDASGICS